MPGRASTAVASNSRSSGDSWQRYRDPLTSAFSLPLLELEIEPLEPLELARAALELDVDALESLELLGAPQVVLKDLLQLHGAPLDRLTPGEVAEQQLAPCARLGDVVRVGILTHEAVGDEEGLAVVAAGVLGIAETSRESQERAVRDRRARVAGDLLVERHGLGVVARLRAALGEAEDLHGGVWRRRGDRGGGD